MAGSTPPSNFGDGAPLVRTGEVVAGKFRIERVLGQGGMGVVVAATHLQLDEIVALKFLRAHASADPETVARFTREARAAAKLKSEHVARVLDAGVTDEGTPYIVMEHLEGRTLGRLLEEQGRLDVATAAEFAIQTCEGLAEAHARGIVHRDIKPENLFLVERSQGWRVVKILDFGISKFEVARGAAESNISTQSMMGSPCYMSPEQLRSTASVDHRTDIWSLGATMFELLAGGTPFRAGQSLPQLIAEILEKPTPRLVDYWHDVPEELSAVVARCMAKNRDDRFANAAEVALAFLPFAPKRVRSNVERAIAVTQLANPSSNPATLWSDPPAAHRSAGDSTAVAPVSGTLRSATSTKTPDAVDNLDTLAAPTMPVSGEKKRSRLPGIALAFAVLGALLLLVWRLTAREQASLAPPSESALPATVQHQDPDTPSASPPSPPAATSSADIERAPSTTEPAGGIAPGPSAARPAPRLAPTVRHAPPSPSGAPAGLDIRMER
jgi:eukaryotic-like serine/threonine-protein kinase